MNRASAVGFALSMLVGLYAVLVGLVNAPVWGLIVLAVIDGFYWAFGRRLLFPEDMDKATERRSRDDRRAKR